MHPSLPRWPQLLVALATCRLAFAALPVFAAAPEAAAAAGAVIRYELPAERFVSLNVTRPDGWVVRELIVDEKQRAGPHTVPWDGRDNYGRMLPAGEYAFRVLTHQGITWDYVASVGNSGTPAWPTADGTGGWGGNHGNPTAVATDATGVYLGWCSTEGPYCVLKRSPDGTRGIWGITLGPFEGVTHLATDGDFLYAANPKRLLKLDPASGKVLASVPLSSGRAAGDQAPLVVPKDSVSFNFWREDQGGWVWGLAATGTRVCVSLPAQNVIAVFDAADLAARPAENIPLHRPRGLAAAPRGRLLAVSDGKVFELDLAAKSATVRVANGLDAPFAVARAADGTIWVGELAPLHQVKRFTAAGLAAATFGRRGGGPDLVGGAFQAHDFHWPCAVAAGVDGSVWVVEDMIPKRMARIDGTTGKVLYQGFGSVNYAALTAPNPNDPAEIFSTMWGTFTGRIDYDRKGQWQVGRMLRERWGAAGQGVLAGQGLGGNPERLIARNGLTYMWTGNGLYIVRPDYLQPVLWFSPRIPDQGPLAALATQRGASNRGWNTDCVLWTDVNGDAAVQPDEVQFVALPGAKHGPQYYGDRYLADDFTLSSMFGYAWKPRSFTPGGAPLYDLADLVKAPSFDPGNFWQEGGSPMRDAAGCFYNLHNGNNPTVPRGAGFWSGRSSESYVLSFAPDWSPRWAIGQKADQGARPGQMYWLWRSIGSLGDCLFFGDVEGVVHVLHRDGFYIQRILQDPFFSPRPGPDLLQVENFSGTVFEHPQTHRRYLYISSNQASHVFELGGIEKITVSPPQKLLSAGPVEPGEAAAAVGTGRYVICRVPPGARASGSCIPNVGLDWNRDVTPLLIERDGKLAAEVRLLYDDQKLYVRADVFSDHGFDNNTISFGANAVWAAQDAGDVVELLLCTDLTAKKGDAAPGLGNQRLMFVDSWPANHVLAIQRAVSDAEPGFVAHEYAGPSGKTTMQVSTLIANDWQCAGSLHGNGYTLQGAIPLDKIQWPGAAADAARDELEEGKPAFQPACAAGAWVWTPASLGHRAAAKARSRRTGRAAIRGPWSPAIRPRRHSCIQRRGARPSSAMVRR